MYPCVCACMSMCAHVRVCVRGPCGVCVARVGCANLGAHKYDCFFITELSLLTS